MDENLPASSGHNREDTFDTAVRGYNRAQVHEYMARTSQLVASLEQNLNLARAEAERARADADAAHAELERARLAQAEAKPVHEEVSGRLSQILKLAAEEADQERATAEAEIAKLRAESQAEAERLVEEARAEAEHDLTVARETAERELADARAQSEQDLTAAREEAERLRSVSVQQADELLDEAQRRAGAVNDVSSQRLETLTATHGEAVLRLGQIRDVLADLLDRDAAAGSLAQVVEAVISPAAVEGVEHHELGAGEQPGELPAEPEVTDQHEVTAEHELPAREVTAEQPVVDVDATELHEPVLDETAVQRPVAEDETREFYAEPTGVQDVEVIDVEEERPAPSGASPAGARDRRGVPTRR